MTPERWLKTDRILEAALERAEPERSAFLDEACVDDPSLRHEVEALLLALKNAGSFIETPAIEVDAALVADKTTHLEPGRSISRYQIIHLLGEGGMGEVYLAKDTVLGRKVALKVLPALFTTNEDRLRRFQQEAQSTSALNHPNILTIHEVNESNGTYFMVTEFIDGETLRDRLSNGPLSFVEALEITAQVADALDAAHEATIVHRDIKPENIMIRRRDRLVKVLDFGLAKLTELRQSHSVSSEMPTEIIVKTSPGVVMGTVNYMSPEQTRGLEVTTRTDIWSLGVVLYELVAGRLPFKGETANDVIPAILRDEPVPLARYAKNVPPELRRIVTKALRKRIEERYQTVKDMALDLKSLKRRLEFEAQLDSGQTPEGKVQRSPATSVRKRSSSDKGETPITSPSDSSLSGNPSNLSGMLPRLVGREKEIAELVSMLKSNDVRLVTLTGVGGTGKTSLAHAVAHKVLEGFVDGLFFVDLSVVNDPQLVFSSIAQPLGVKESGGKVLVDVLLDYLRDRAMLLVLDNFEQVTAAASDLATLLAVAPKLKILVTSRAVLHLTAEREFAVPPLALPIADHLFSPSELQKYSAIALFVERARLVKSNFTLTDENSSAVASICARLDGLPLAIVLAAAWIRVLSPAAILTRLESQLKLLIGGARDLPARQQTMRGAIAWSYDLLDQDEKTLLNRLSVFGGGCTLEEVESVCGEEGTEALVGIESLLDTSLLLQNEQDERETRFRMLEAVKEYAKECLKASDEADAIQARHAAYFVALAEEAEPHLYGSQQAKWLVRLEDEHDNIRIALQWLLAHDADGALRLAGAVGLFWTLHGHFTEGRSWLDETLQKDGDAVLRTQALIGAGRLAWLQGDYPAARKFYDEGLRLAKETSNKRQIALAARGLGVVCFLEGDNDRARGFLEESLAIRRELKDKVGMATTLNTLGEVARVEEDYATARKLYEESVALARDTGLQEVISANLNNLGAVACHEGDYATARGAYNEALSISQSLGHKAGIAISLDGCAALALHSEEAVRAARLAGASLALYESIGFELETNERNFREHYIAALLADLGEQAFNVAVEEGRALSMNDAIALGLGKPGGL